MGFIGSRLANSLISLGYRVAVLDDLSTGRYMDISKAKKELKWSPGVSLEQGLKKPFRVT
jgi:nucleoside-diphosphate-sugar epimerase